MRALKMLLCILILTAPVAAQSLAKGFASVDKKKLVVRSAIAVWKPASHNLVISFFGHELSKSHLEALKKVPADYVVADSPKPKPFLRLDLEFDPKSKGKFDPKDVTFQAVTLWRMRGNDNISAQRSEAFGEWHISGDFRTARSIKVKAKGNYEFREGYPLVWDVQAHCHVYKGK